MEQATRQALQAYFQDKEVEQVLLFGSHARKPPLAIVITI